MQSTQRIQLITTRCNANSKSLCSPDGIWYEGRLNNSTHWPVGSDRKDIGGNYVLGASDR